MNIEINKKAPDFIGFIDENKTISLKDFLGKWVVLYFYPKDNTSGCTKEACDFRDNMSTLTEEEAIVIGVSPDSISSHKKFAQKHNLNFYLISDTSKEICNLYNVIVEKSMYGKKYLGVERSTFIIDPKGIIKKIYRKVKVEGHIQQIINDLKELKQKFV